MLPLISAMAVGVVFLTALLISFELRLISKELKRSNEISDKWWDDHSQYDSMGNKFLQERIDKVVQDLNIKDSANHGH